MITIAIEGISEEQLKRMANEDTTDREFFALEEKDLGGLRRYIEQRIEPGGFLSAVLSNDLKEAAGRADFRNRRRLFEYVQWLYNHAPAQCWGSEKKFNAWLDNNGV